MTATTPAPRAGSSKHLEDRTDPNSVLLVVGTRPEAIKLAGVARALGPQARVIHTGQHYDDQMWTDVIADLPHLRIQQSLRIGGRSRGEQIGEATVALTTYLQHHPVRAVVVQGDTNSTLAGALAASAAGIPLVHVEAGLRSHDRSMPEELNRLLVDTVADLCCAPVEANAAQLRSEGVTTDRIAVTGNTLSCTMSDLLPTDDVRDTTLAKLDLRPQEYVLATLHRAGNVDDPTTLKAMVTGLARLSESTDVVLPLHPHTRKRLVEHGLMDALHRVRVVAPMTPREFLTVESVARLLVSDSGGVQEEACLLRRPLLILRDSTERPELLEGWSRLLGDQDPGEAMDQAWQDSSEWLAGLADRAFPYPDLPASEIVVAEINARWP